MEFGFYGVIEKFQPDGWAGG